MWQRQPHIEAEIFESTLKRIRSRMFHAFRPSFPSPLSLLRSAELAKNRLEPLKLWYSNLCPQRDRTQFDHACVSFQAPVQSMQPTARGNPRVPSPGPLRPFTPPDLSSIPHMDGTPLHNSNSNNNNNASPANGNRANDGAQESTGPFIIGSPIDLGDIDNVDNIGIRLASATRDRTREHIELQETGSPDSPLEGKPSELTNRSKKLSARIRSILVR